MRTAIPCGKARPCDAGHAVGVRPTPLGADRPGDGRNSNTPGSLGNRRPDRQRGPCSYGPIPQWVKHALDVWTVAAGVTEGRIFRAVSRAGKVWGEGISQNLVWYVVRSCCRRAGLDHIAPHDLRRTCAKLCYASGGELEQIQFLLGHASVLTTERYLGCKQNLGHPVFFSQDRCRSLMF